MRQSGIIIHRAIFHTTVKTSPSPTLLASHVPNWGPKITNTVAAMTNSDEPRMSNNATMRTFHQGRLSSTPYARFKPAVIAVMALEDVHNAATIPKDSNPPLGWVTKV